MEFWRKRLLSLGRFKWMIIGCQIVAASKNSETLDLRVYPSLDTNLGERKTFSIRI